MQFTTILALSMGAVVIAAPMAHKTTADIGERTDSDSADEYVVYPDIDRDEDVVYAYHAVNDRREEIGAADEYVVYPDIDRDEDVVYAYHAVNDK